MTAVISLVLTLTYLVVFGKPDTLDKLSIVIIVASMLGLILSMYIHFKTRSNQ